MPIDSLFPDSDSLRAELRILQAVQTEAVAVAAYIRMSKKEQQQFEAPTKRIGELLAILATEY